MFYLLNFYSYLNINSSIVYNSTSKNELNDLINFNNAEYVMAPKYELKQEAIDLIKNNHTIIYENSRYLFFKI